MPAWEKTKHGGKAVFDKGWAAFEKLGGPVNKLTNKIGSEAFWPTGLGPESDKAARILKSFCKDGFYKEQPAVAGSPSTPTSPTAVAPRSPGPKNKPKVLVKIPQKVIQNAVGLAIFSVWRTGLWVSAAGGSGVLVARKEDGSWGPPSGILIHTIGVGFMAGIDVYDCVLVINNKEALDAFSKMRVSLGGEVSIVAGPLGAGGVLESELYKNSKKPVFSYVKSRGLYGGLQVDGTIILERNDENANFYKERLPIHDILAGRMKIIPRETHMLAEVLKQADGRTDIDHGVVDQANNVPLPSDVDVGKMSGNPQDQKQDYAHAAPPQYDPATAQAYGVAPQAYNASGPGYAPQGESSAYVPPPQHHDEKIPAYDTPSGAGYAPPLAHGDAAGYTPHDPSLYEASPATPHSPHQFPPPRSPLRTDSGFAPPPGPPPRRTDSGFPAPPPPASSAHPVPEKRDPDGPPGYS